jgi:hypothetical protein
MPALMGWGLACSKPKTEKVAKMRKKCLFLRIFGD